MNSPESARESIRVCEHFLGDDYAAVPWLCLTIGRGVVPFSWTSLGLSLFVVGDSGVG